MRRVATTILLCLAAAAPPVQPASQAQLERMIAYIQASHIAGNVPPPAAFDRLLQRDLQTYFARRGIRKPIVRYALLRDAPTQSGIAYPKYYLWVSVWSRGRPAASGAARVEAIERKRFEITHFVARTEILSDPEAISSVFPAPLIGPIRERAAEAFSRP
jgi:hypothetical protein